MPQLSTGHIFMSYSRRDDAAMRRVVLFLRKQGVKVWVDNEKLTPGTPIWEEEIEKAIQNASAVVVVLSPDSKGSEWVRREISLADQYGRRVFPVLVRGDEKASISLRLINRQFVDIRENEDAGLSALETALSEYLQELKAQEQKTKTDAQKLAREKAKREAAEKADIKTEEIGKEPLIAAQSTKNEPAQQRSTNGVLFVNQIKQKLIASPKNTIIGFGGILLMVILVIWGTTFRANQAAKDNSGFYNTTITETPTLQQTLEAIIPTIGEITNTPLAITATTPPQTIGERASGVSVSHWDAAIDWAKVKNTGIGFAFIKATEGITYTDDKFAVNWAGSKSAGILRAPYHFFRANVDPTAQADYFIQAVKAMGDNGELPPVLDLETNDGVSKEIVIANVKIWLDLVEQGLGRKPIIYSTQYFLRDNFSDVNGEPPAWAKDYPLWLAQYLLSNYSKDQQPTIPNGWSTWTFWQYTDRGTLNGIAAKTYINVFNGSLSDLQKFASNKKALGIDVSHWDAGIDWVKVKNTGIDFVFIKATEGNNYTDDTFNNNWTGAKSVGILRAPYHFFRTNVDPAKQAEHFIQAVKAMGDNGELPPVLDVETNGGESKEIIVASVKIWLELVEQGLGRKPMIYSTQHFLQDYLSIASGGPPVWAKDYPLCMAWYPNQYADGMEPPLPRGWFTWVFWEYSDKGAVDGINANANLNIFNGSVEELYQFSSSH